jgi:hypothetical protein
VRGAGERKWICSTTLNGLAGGCHQIASQGVDEVQIEIGLSGGGQIETVGIKAAFAELERFCVWCSKYPEA